MKIRIGFISNSSSSSFIILGKKPENIFCKELSKIQAKMVIDYYNSDEFTKEEIKWDGEEKVFLTIFLSDGGYLYDEVDGYIYSFGSHVGPYSEDFFDLIAEENAEFFSHKVWILKEHNPKINIL